MLKVLWSLDFQIHIVILEWEFPCAPFIGLSLTLRKTKNFHQTYSQENGLTEAFRQVSVSMLIESLLKRIPLRFHYVVLSLFRWLAHCNLANKHLHCLFPSYCVSATMGRRWQVCRVCWALDIEAGLSYLPLSWIHSHSTRHGPTVSLQQHPPGVSSQSHLALFISSLCAKESSTSLLALSLAIRKFEQWSC